MNLLMLGGILKIKNMDNYLIKTVTLAEAHESDSIGNPVYWASYLELPIVNDTTDTNIYLVSFEDNAATANYREDFIIYYRTSSAIKALDARNGRSNSSATAYQTSRSSWASIGTKISVYKIPCNSF